jgi:hypothetical protein
MDEIRVLGYCECCGNQITDEDDYHYVNENGEMFCSVECVCEHYGVIKREV